MVTDKTIPRFLIFIIFCFFEFKAVLCSSLKKHNNEKKYDFSSLISKIDRKDLGFNKYYNDQPTLSNLKKEKKKHYDVGQIAYDIPKAIRKIITQECNKAILKSLRISKLNDILEVRRILNDACDKVLQEVRGIVSNQQGLVHLCNSNESKHVKNLFTVKKIENNLQTFHNEIAEELVNKAQDINNENARKEKSICRMREEKFIVGAIALIALEKMGDALTKVKHCLSSAAQKNIAKVEGRYYKEGWFNDISRTYTRYTSSYVYMSEHLTSVRVTIQNDYKSKINEALDIIDKLV